MVKKSLQKIVGPPSGIDWRGPRHELLYVWNGRVETMMARFPDFILVPGGADAILVLGANY